VAAPELSRADSGSWGRRTRGGLRAAPGWVAEAGAAGHMAAPKPTSAGRRGPELQLAWQRVDTRPAPCPDLELVCGGTRSSGYRQWPPGPPRERLRTRRWGQFFGAPLGYLDLFTRQSITGLREVPELKVRERPRSTRKRQQRTPGRCRS
jgi:hypothetical protein